MPPRSSLPPEQFEARTRELTRLRVARHRERRNVTENTCNVTAHPGEGLVPLPSHSSPLPVLTPFEPPPPPTEGTPPQPIWGQFEAVREVLEPFRSRGKLVTPQYLERLRQGCPRVDLVAAALEASQWLRDPDNLTRQCNNAFLGNWVRETARRAQHGHARPVLRRPQPTSALGRVLEQIATSPVEGPSTWGHR